MTVVATELRQIRREPTYFFANPSNLRLITGNGLGVSDLDTPAPLRLPVKARYDPKTHKRVVHILRQSLRRNTELYSRPTILGREDAAIA
jgi:hypothetical protein